MRPVPKPNQRNVTCTSGPIPNAKTTVPMPAVPPSVIPITSTVTSITVRAHRIDRMIKGVETGDPWESVLEMSLGLAGRPVLKAA